MNSIARTGRSAALAAAVVLLLPLVLSSCASRAPKARGLDPKLSLTSYIEDGKLVAFVVGTKLMRIRSDSEYVPVEVGIANRGVERLTITPESFTLVDGDGNRYPVVSGEELQNGYGSIDVDRRLADVPALMNAKFQSFEFVRSTLTESFDKPILRDLVLHRYSYSWDFIYFPRPETGVRGERFELFLDTPELEDPVFVSFAVAE